MAKIFKPRRALRSSVKSGSKRTLVLASGELMLVGKTAIGEGSKADLYLGDGVSQMQNLSPAMYGDSSEEDITITDDASTTASAALGNVTTGKTLGAILGSLKKAISLNAAAITTLNDEASRWLCQRIQFEPTISNASSLRLDTLDLLVPYNINFTYDILFPITMCNGESRGVIYFGNIFRDGGNSQTLYFSTTINRKIYIVLARLYKKNY